MLNEKIFNDRRPEMYLNLPTDPYLWNPLDFFNLYGLNPLPKGKKSLVSIVQMSSNKDSKKI